MAALGPTEQSLWARLYVGTEAVGVGELVGRFVNIWRFTEFVLQKWSKRLQHADAFELKVYASEEDRKADKKLAVDRALTDVATTADNPIVIVAPPAGVPAGEWWFLQREGSSVYSVLFHSRCTAPACRRNCGYYWYACALFSVCEESDRM